MGISKFEGLDPSKEYETVLDKNDPKLQTTITKNGKSIQMTKDEIIDKIGSYAILSKLRYENSEDPASDIFVLLLDDNGYVLKKGKTNLAGQVQFENLEKGQSYQVIIDKNHPELQVDALHNGKMVTVNSKKILEKFSKLKVLSKIEYASSDEPATEIPVMLLDENGILLKKGSTNSEGVAVFDMPADNKKYSVVVDKKQLALNKAIKMTADGKFERIFFDFNSAFVRSEDEEVVKEVANFLSIHPDKSMKIIAHTDNVGDYGFNKELSRLRGLAVKELLLQKGVAPEQLMVEAIGMDNPILSNDRELGRQINRRVEFDIL
jgi:outer membrane protein OmpA-like peptidoglycan-associated protein